MKKTINVPYSINSIADLHRLLELPKPLHPLVSVIDMSGIKCHFDESMKSVIYNFYSICIKKNFKGKLKYGQQYYDFDQGTMTFFSPGQVISTVVEENIELEGCWLTFHPDFVRNYPLGKLVDSYGYFSYATNEALHLSDAEEQKIASIMQQIAEEYHHVIDFFSQDVMVTQIELLLSYCNRYYTRQFITRKNASSELLTKFESILSAYFEEEKTQEFGLPTVPYLASALNVSPNYLSDMLRALTGQSTQHHIHHHVIEKAKKILTSTSQSVSEIAYQLGFEYPQSFNKLFKNKTNLSPLAFRSSFN